MPLQEEMERQGRTGGEHDELMHKAVRTKTKKFCSDDNIGTVFTNVKEVNVAWTADGMSFGKDQRANVRLTEKDGSVKIRIAGCVR